MPDQALLHNGLWISHGFFHNFPIFLIFCSWFNACITDPAPKKSKALKKACVTRWKIAKLYREKPAAINMNPNWLQVEYAIILFISFWVKATEAAKIAVREPIKIKKFDAKIELLKNKDILQIKKTPTVTIVAAWIRADTGVGASIASGNHVWKGHIGILTAKEAKKGNHK